MRCGDPKKGVEGCGNYWKVSKDPKLLYRHGDNKCPECGSRDTYVRTTQ